MVWGPWVLIWWTCLNCIPKAARPRPASPDLARPHLVGVVGCSWVQLGAVGRGCAKLQCAGVSRISCFFEPLQGFIANSQGYIRFRKCVWSTQPHPCWHLWFCCFLLVFITICMYISLSEERWPTSIGMGWIGVCTCYISYFFPCWCTCRECHMVKPFD